MGVTWDIEGVHHDSVHRYSTSRHDKSTQNMQAGSEITDLVHSGQAEAEQRSVKDKYPLGRHDIRCCIGILLWYFGKLLISHPFGMAPHILL